MPDPRGNRGSRCEGKKDRYRVMNDDSFADLPASVFGPVILRELQACGSPASVELSGACGDSDPFHQLLQANGVKVSIEGNRQHPPKPLVLAVLRGPASKASYDKLFAEALDCLAPNGWLLVAGWVVSHPQGPPVLAISQVVEAINRATGMGVQLEELRSVHVPGDTFTRGAVMRMRLL